MKRTITGIILFAFLFGFVMLTEVTRYVFDGLILIAMAVATYEMIKATRQKGFRPSVIPICITIASIYPMMYFFDMKGYLIVAGISFLTAFVFYIFDSKMSIFDFLITLLIGVYPIMLFSLSFHLLNNYGMLPLILPMAAAMMSDTFAFYFGSLIKGPKIFPTISPKKTYAGCIFGLLGGAVGAILVYALFEVAGVPVCDPYRFGVTLKYPILFYCLIGVAIAVVSELGDLAASRIKRSLEIKDFSKLLGSHGGIMDRLDSILFSVVFMSIVMAFLPSMPL